MIVAALIEPTEVAAVTMPPSEEHEILFQASYAAFNAHGKAKAAEYDFDQPEVKKGVEDKVEANAAKLEHLILDAVNQGMTPYQAHMGVVVAQMKALEAIDKPAVEEAKQKAMQRQSKIPAGKRDKYAQRNLARHQRELDEVKLMTKDEDKAKYVKKEVGKMLRNQQRWGRGRNSPNRANEV